MKKLLISIIYLSFLGCNQIQADPEGQQKHLSKIGNLSSEERHSLKNSPDSYWKSALNSSQYKVCRHDGTERAFSGQYVDEKREGAFLCSSCGTPLFHSKHKFKSGTGWPSFFDVPDSAQVELKEDRSWGMTRTEVRCAVCDAHLGHVFNDGPKPTGKRYCINSVCLLHEQDLP